VSIKIKLSTLWTMLLFHDLLTRHKNNWTGHWTLVHIIFWAWISTYIMMLASISCSGWIYH
jgi:hypothetical protein